MRAEEFAPLFALEAGHWWFRGMREITAAILDPVAADLAPGGEPVRILDIGCGTGLMLSWLERYSRGAPVTGLEYSAGGIAFCRSRGHTALVHGTATRDRIPRLAGVVSDDERVLSEDPFVPASRGQRPVVLDSFMLITLLERHPEWRRDIVERIESAEFDKIVLYYVPDEAPQWYRRVHLGPDVVGAIEARYRPARHVDGYWIYVPR